MQSIMAFNLRIALGHTAISLSTLKRKLIGDQEVDEAIKQLEKVVEILQAECKLVETQQTPTLRIGNENESLSLPFTEITHFLQEKENKL